jgi:predicted N-acyltransferase
MSNLFNSFFRENPLAFLSENTNIKLFHRISEIDKNSWNSLIGKNNPLLEYEFLKAMEVSNSIGTKSTWLPYYLALFDGKNLIGAIPLYLKYNSYGEYIFDWSWASAYSKSGLNYYPKFVIAVPYTPASGNRILVHPDSTLEEVGNTLIPVIKKMATALKVSSIHWLFILEEEMDLLRKHGFMARYTYQFHWRNNNYKTFDDFLGEFNSKKRNQIKRERKQANTGIEIEVLSGNQLKDVHWKAMYRFYMNTSSRKWGHAYLTEEFFAYIAANFPEQVVMVLAKRGDKYIAGALNFRKGEHLYGRYWGCLEEHQCLHFEICYYQSIDYAIREGITLFEAGAQGEHKIVRGFLPAYTYSAHWIENKQFSSAIDDFLKRERFSVTNLIENHSELSPFKIDHRIEKK